MYVTKHMDWLSITFDKGTDIARIFPLLDFRYAGIGRHGYQARYSDPVTQLEYMEGASNQDMGVHCTFTGDALNAFRSQWGGDDGKLAQLLAAHRGVASRIDLALNIHEGKLTVADIHKAVKNGSCRARSKTYRLVSGVRDNIAGDTLYVGSPRSDVQLRVYDKAAERGIVDGAAWLRLELELRGERARGAFQSCAGNGVPATVSGHVAEFLHWNNHELSSAISGPSAEPYELPRKETNRKRWLLGQVAQALAKEIAYEPSFRDTFNQAVDYFLEAK